MVSLMAHLTLAITPLIVMLKQVVVIKSPFTMTHPLTKTKRALEGAELKMRLSDSLVVSRHSGVTTGDRVVVYMPMVPEALVAISRLCSNRSNPFGCFWWVCS